MPNNTKNNTKIKSKRFNNICDECGAKMQPEGSCFICLNCGNSPCK